MTFRPASLADDELLLRWRREEEAESWFRGNPIIESVHTIWFARNMPRIKIWEQRGTALGCVRFESDGSIHFHPPADDEQAVAMLKSALSASFNHGGRLKCVLDLNDMRRADLLALAGFQQAPVRFFLYRPVG